MFCLSDLVTSIPLDIVHLTCVHQYLCDTTKSERFKWRAPADLGAGDNIPVTILAFLVQSGESLAEMEASTPAVVDPAAALQANGEYQTDSVLGRCVHARTMLLTHYAPRMFVLCLHSSSAARRVTVSVFHARRSEQ